MAEQMNLVAYQDLRQIVRNGDLLLWRARTLSGRVIQLFTGGYSHASMAAWARHGRLYTLEMLQGRGGRHIPLSDYLHDYPQDCQIWRPVSPAFDGDGAVLQMLWLMGQYYGWRNFLHIAARILAPKLAFQSPPNSHDPDQALVCSSAYAWAARTGGGVAPCPDTPDADITPADLAASGFAQYLATPVL